MSSPNRDQLVRVARALGPLLGGLVFVGGQVGELLVTDPAAIRVRPTDDVDVVCRAATRGAYYRIAERLRELGFKEDARERAPMCRWRLGEHDVLDVMPSDETVLGLSSRWYEAALRSAQACSLTDDLVIPIVSAPVFLAMKWETFNDRGAGDLYGSHDIEDIVTVVAGRPTIVEEVTAADTEIRQYIAEHTRRFVEGGATPDIIAGALPDARLAPGIVNAAEGRFLELARLYEAGSADA